MRNEDLKPRLIHMDHAELLERVRSWRDDRAYWQANSIQPKRKAQRKRKSKVETMLAGLTDEQRAALIAELER